LEERRLPDTQYGHNVCDFFGFPHPGHFTTLFTSFKALPAKRRCRLFMCDVFFLGTALSIPSQMSDSNDGMLIAAVGSAMLTDAIRSEVNRGRVCVEKLKSPPVRSSEVVRAAMMRTKRH
jgi:hypothetical protein